MPPTGIREGCDSGEVVIYHMVEEILPGAVRSGGKEGGREGRREGGREGGRGRMGKREGKRE